MNGTSRGVRNAFRNPTRSISIVVIVGLAIGLALSMLVAHQAVAKKIASVKSSVGNTISISPAGARGFEGGGTALTEAELAKVAKLSHVTKVDEILSDRLSSTDTNLTSAVDFGSLGQRFAQRSNSNPPPLSGGGFGGGTNGTTDFASRAAEITVIGTTTPTNLSGTQGGGTFKLTSGAAFAGDSGSNVALIGKSLASKNNLKVGSTFTAYNGTTITVKGIFDAGNTFSNNQIIMPLKTVQILSGQAGSITSATAVVDSVTNVTSVTKSIQSTLGSSVADVTNDASAANTAVASLKNIQSISLYSLIGAVVAGAVIILLTMIMIVRERRREIGVLKAIGASNIKVMWQFMSEAVTLTLVGAIVGIAFGVLTAKPITDMLVNNSNNTSSSSQTVGVGSQAGGTPTRTFHRQSNFADASGRAGQRASKFVSGGISGITTNVGWNIVTYGLGVAVIIALAGSAVASFFIAKVRPAEVMRAD